MSLNRFPLSDNELTRLIKESDTCHPLELKFGPSGAWLEWDPETTPEVPWHVQKLAKMRGIDTSDYDVKVQS